VRERFAARVLDHHDIEEIVRSSLDRETRLAVTSSADVRHCLTLTIQAKPSTSALLRPGRSKARIATNGVDTFVLDLDDRFEYRDIDWEPQGQGEILRLMTGLAQAYLAGAGREAEKRGLTGRRYRQLILELDGESYRFKGKRLD
jgi:hypothetical protein